MTTEELTALSLERSTVIRVEWEDITADSVGDTNKAHTTKRSSVSYFWESKVSEETGSQILVTTDTIDPDGPQQQGWTAIPLSIVLEIEIIRRPKKGRKKKETTP